MSGEPQRKLRIGVWAVDLPRQGRADDPGLLRVIDGFVAAGQEVVLVAEEWSGPTPPGVEVKLRSPWEGMPSWAKALRAAARMRARTRPFVAWVRGRLARLRKRKTRFLMLPVVPLLLLVRHSYLLLSAAGRPLSRLVERRRIREVARMTPGAVAAEPCDVWLVLSGATTFPFCPGARCAWLLDGPPDRPAPPVIGESERAHWHGSQVRDFSFNGMVFLVQSREILSDLSFVGWAAAQDRHFVLPPGQPGAWLDVLRRAATLPLTREELLPAQAADRPYHVHLFLPEAYRGGVWEAVRTLLTGLQEVNRRRGNPLRVSLAFRTGQAGLDELAADMPGVPFEILSQQLFPADGGGTEELLWSPSALLADAWVSLVDRFHKPIMVARPLGVVVYDVIQRYLPEIFSKEFHEHYIPSMRATVARADRVVTTNRVTRLDVVAEYGLPLDRVALVPVACEPAAKFDGRPVRPVPVPSGHLLNVTNTSPHKGIEVVLRGYARLKGMLGGRGPGLVFSGYNTQRIDPACPGTVDDVLRHLRGLLGELGLVAGEDVWFLGYTDDAQLHDLYARCHAVINAARHDNGSFSLIEGRYFGKSVVCSRYPAAVALYEHFGIPVDYFEAGDDGDLAATLFRVMDRPSLAGEELARCREALADPKFSHRRYAEQVYDLVFDMARRGRGAGRRAA